MLSRSRSGDLLKRFAELLEQQDIVSSRQKSKLEKAALKIVDRLTISEIEETYGHIKAFQDLLSTSPVVLSLLISNNSWKNILACQLLLNLQIGLTGQSELVDMFFFITGKVDDEAGFTDELFFEIYEDPVNIPILKSLVSRLSPKCMTVVVNALIRRIQIALASSPTEDWRGKIDQGLMSLSYAIYETGKLPPEAFYFTDQSLLLREQETLVQMKYDPEVRQKVKYVYPFCDLQTKWSIVELDNNIQMRHELQVLLLTMNDD